MAKAIPKIPPKMLIPGVTPYSPESIQTFYPTNLMQFIYSFFTVTVEPPPEKIAIFELIQIGIEAHFKQPNTAFANQH